jgi:FlaA1/EpsC-like NDP-sugar epimerase
MKNIAVKFFLLGIMIACTISVLILSAVMAIATEAQAVPVSFIWQSLVLSVLCSVINLVYRSEKLKFIWQSVIGYILTTATIISCGLIFNWYSYGGNSLDRRVFILISFLVYSLFYLITWIIIWKITKAKKKELNDKLREFKQKQ